MPGSAIETSATISSLPRPLSLDERDEMIALGLIARNGDPLRPPSTTGTRAARLEKHAMHAHAVLNEAYDYARAASFTRGIRFELGDKTLLLISGTASVDEAGLTTHAGDFR